METIHTEQYKGYTIKIVPDDCYETPDDWGDDGLFLVSFHRDFTVERDGFSKDVCVELMQEKKNRDEDYKEQCAEIEKEYHVFGLEAYIHSGVSLSLSYTGNYPDRKWDVSQVGLVFVSKKETRYTKKAEEMAKKLLKTWNACLEGSVYGFIVEDEEGERVDSCWGYIETEWDIQKTEVLKQARESADYYAKKRLEKHIAKAKEQIKAHVPLQYRVALT